MAIFDCFTFYNELELLEIRFKEMAQHVDYFVIAESPKTFQGDDKPLYFHENRKLFRKYAPKIRHLVVNPPETTDPWQREFHQRNELKKGLSDAAEDDIIFISDADEIICSNSIKRMASMNHFCFGELICFFYYMDLTWGEQRSLVYSVPYNALQKMTDVSEPRIKTYSYLKSIGLSADEAIVPNAGWHMSYLGGPKRIIQKLGAFSHTEEGVQKWADQAKIEKEIFERRFFHDGRALSTVAIDSLPLSIQENAYNLYKEGFISQNIPAPAWHKRVLDSLKAAVFRQKKAR